LGSSSNWMPVECYERDSVLMTSKLPFSKLKGIFKDPMTTAAAIGRMKTNIALDFLSRSSVDGRVVAKSFAGHLGSVSTFCPAGLASTWCICSRSESWLACNSFCAFSNSPLASTFRPMD